MLKEKQKPLEHPTVEIITPCEIDDTMKLCSVKYYRPNWLNRKYNDTKGLLGQYYFDELDDGHYIVVGFTTMISLFGGIEPNKVRAHMMCVLTGAVSLRTIKTTQTFDKNTHVSIDSDDLIRVRDRIFKEAINYVR